MKQPAVYIMSSKKNGTLYIGVTSNLYNRVFQHKNKLITGFTSRYNIKDLIYYELTNDISVAINREKQLKRWSRKKKINLFKESNPEWEDLAKEWYLDISTQTLSSIRSI